MRKTIYAKMTALPVGLCALAFAVTSCGSSEYKKFADNEGKQVASILRSTGRHEGGRSLCGLDCYGGSLGERAARFRG